ncbi:hypothetical protein IM792_15510 [Mucilaginibacter sp. JRF]|jgi:lambda repressor-like predicted transcriptional regulator|uniref:hypothetical protein n=1 Tax=Mucilaginibacter sp. JRF TaxID=2780088 RepID=UPI00187F9121|nr:hypothetical protein [Mucilaginibacter sp. JRF]MBE9585863.1 hypothetical protein [Mucilaginibacter sp. JRF]
MNKHHGQLIEYRVRKNGYSISDLARNLNVNRRSIYNWFNQPYIKKDVILHIGIILRHDFSQEFPEMFTSEEFESVHKFKPTGFGTQRTVTTNQDDEIYKDKYVNLLEKYNMLLLKSL